VIAESCYLLRRLPGAPEVVLENVTQGVFLIPFQLSRAATPVRNIMRKYSDVPADFADACLIHLADELNTGEILTLDRDFTQYRWRRNRNFDLLIDLR
jgi:predicted nucleic acid-binding protein